MKWGLIGCTSILAVLGLLVVLSVVLVALIDSNSSDRDESGVSERADSMVSAYNLYIDEFSVPIAATADRCLSGRVVTENSPQCRQWITWTQDKSRLVDAAILSMEKPIGEASIDQWRRAVLAVLRQYRQAYSEMAIAIRNEEAARWEAGLARFRAAQQAGQRADELRFDLLESE